MNLLYLSVHSILEYDELKIFEELGIKYCSLGSYLDPQSPVDKIRPELKQERVAEWYNKAPYKENIPKEYADMFDVIIVMHEPNFIDLNWQNIKHKRVIWRTIGQSTPETERRLKKYRDEGLEVVRYSTKEVNIIDNIGCDALIRFYKDENEFKNYNGMNPIAMTLCQNMKNRAEWCNYDAWEKVSEGVPLKIYGKDNANMGERFGGFLTYDELKQKMRDNAVYFYVGTQPASYTLNFIEAFMTGIPIVAIGRVLGNSLSIAGDLYEVEDIIQNGVNGYVSDDVEELKTYINKLLAKPTLAKYIGACGRQTAVELFGKENIKAKWKEFLKV